QQHINICLIRRPSTMKNHAGQIAFPGGKREKEDVNLIQTALREAQEEIGLDPGKVGILGVLSTVYVQVSDFLITPVLGWLNEMPAVQIETAEVDEVIFISLEEIADPANRRFREVETSTGRIIAPGFEINGSFIWGATAMMLAELVDLFSGTSIVK
ncbi:MAG: CoA pyrophosphatase, partial [Bacteroidetes bacterium]|nr:CoA pyrophosphatase [Bacteroidota bacterium]